MPATPSLTHPEAFPAEILASLEAGEYRSALQQLQQSAVEDWERLAMDLLLQCREIIPPTMGRGNFCGGAH